MLRSLALVLFAIAALGCERAEPISLPQEAVLRIPADAGLQDVDTLLHAGGLLYLSGKDAEGSPSIIAIGAEGKVRSARTFPGMERCQLVPGSDVAVLRDDQGDLFLAPIDGGDSPVAIGVRAGGRYRLTEQVAAGDALVLSAEELSYRGDTFQVVVVSISTGSVLDAQAAREDFELSRSGTCIYLSPRYPRPSDSIFQVEGDLEMPKLEPVPLEPGAVGSAFVGWTSEVGFVRSGGDGLPSARLDRLTVGDRQVRLPSRLNLGRSHLLTERHLLYDALDNSVVVVDLVAGDSWRLSFGSWDGERAPFIELGADGDHAIVCSDDTVVRLSLAGDTPEVTPFE